MTSPLTPRAAQELWRRLGLQGDVERRNWGEDGGWGRLSPGMQVETGEPLFPRLDP